LTSVDGLNWVPHVLDGNASLSTVTYGRGLFVAVGNVVVTSRDGVNWVQRQNLNFPFNSICYAAGQFVAVGDSGSFFTSLDGIEWQQRSSGTTRNLSDVTYGDGHFLVVGEDGTILQSESIITLSATAQPNDGLVTISLTGPAVLTYTV